MSLPVEALVNKMVNTDTVAPVNRNSGVYAEFYTEAITDMLLFEGGVIEKKNPRTMELRKLEIERLRMLRESNPFPDPEPAKGSLEHSDWERLVQQHDLVLQGQAQILKDHPELPDCYLVAPIGAKHVDCEFIRIRIPGDTLNVVERPVRESDKVVYAPQYAAYKHGTLVQDGTPLGQWPALTKAQVKNLTQAGVLTVEQLAEVTDVNLSAIGPYTQLRNTARNYVAALKGHTQTKAVHEVQQENAKLRESLDAMRSALAAQGAQLDELRRESKGKRS